MYDDRSPEEQVKGQELLRREPFESSNSSQATFGPEARFLKPSYQHVMSSQDIASPPSSTYFISMQERPDWTAENMIFWANLYNTIAFHPRRTLHQFYNYMIPDTQTRDLDQVIPRYFQRIHNAVGNEDEESESSQLALTTIYTASETSSRRPSGINDQIVTHPPEVDAESPRDYLLMVDQLWVWVLDDTIAAVSDNESDIFKEFATRWKSRSKESRNSNLPDHPGELFNIDREIDQMKEIKNIQDELHMLSVLSEDQAAVLEGMTHQQGLASDQNLSVVASQQRRIGSLEDQAHQVDNALNRLLDLKQKQANLSAAQSAKWTVEMTEAAQQQGNVIVMFTLLTIFFVLFQLDLVELPEKLHISYVLRWMFGISIAFFVPLTLLMLHTSVIPKTLNRVAIQAVAQTSKLKEMWTARRNKRNRWAVPLSSNPRVLELRSSILAYIG
ncbi:hypothetical protein IFR05_011764 [Cadophora sp. M221]|nr:hypothetical protein IFR05_011764 [Cadophora sp. M221]